MLNINTITLQEIVELSNRIALEQGEDARTEFINQLFSEYHASLA